ncbi:MAG TPA: hypothetical protein VFC00_06885 [Micromonosporaceae bacterium]|nr:hypothetical protein [Micromonosporaceae bacterium]
MEINWYVVVSPLESEPPGGYVVPPLREAALREALRGVTLGAYDERIIAWMVWFLDDSTMRTVVSLIERARLAEASR